MANAGAIKAGSAYVEIALKDNLAGGLDKAAARLKSFGSLVTTAGAGLSGIGAGIVTPILAAAKTFSDIGDQLDKMSARTGLSVEALSELGFAAEQSGATLEDVETAVRKMQKTLGDAATGSKTAQEALAGLGLSYKELASLSPEEQFSIIGQRISAIEDPTRKAAAAMDIFGKSGTSMLPMLNDMEALRKEARDLGIVITTEDAKSAAELNDAMGRLHRVFLSIVTAVGGAVAPVLTDLNNSVARHLGVVKSWIERNRGLIVSVLQIGAVVMAAGAVLIALGGGIAGLGLVLSGLSGIVSAVGVGIGIMGAALSAILSPLGLVITALGALAVYIIYSTGAGGAALTWLGEKFAELQSDATAAFGGIADALATGNITLAAKILWLTLSMEFQKGVKFLSDLWSDVSLAAGIAWDAVYYAAANAWNAVTTVVQNALETVYSLMIKAANAIAQTFWSAVQGVVDAFLWLGEKIFTAGYALHLINDDDLVALDGALKKAREVSKTFTEGQKTQATALYGGEEQASTERAQANTAAYELQKTALTKESDLSANDRTKSYVDNLRASEQALAQAKDEWQTAIAEAKTARTESAAEPESPPSLLDTINQKLLDAGAAVEQNAAKIDVQGTFNASAILGLQSGGAAERTAKAAEETAKNTKRLVDEAKLGGLTFA